MKKNAIIDAHYSKEKENDKEADIGRNYRHNCNITTFIIALLKMYYLTLFIIGLNIKYIFKWRLNGCSTSRRSLGHLLIVSPKRMVG